MKQLQRLSQLNSASYLNKATIRRFFSLSNNTLSQNLKRWTKNGDLIKLKRGIYVTKEYISNNNLSLASYTEFIANILKQPSYLSKEYILQKLEHADQKCGNLRGKVDYGS